MLQIEVDGLRSDAVTASLLSLQRSHGAAVSSPSAEVCTGETYWIVFQGVTALPGNHFIIYIDARTKQVVRLVEGR